MFRMILGALALVLSIAHADAAPSTCKLTFVVEALVANYNSLGVQGGLVESVPPHETTEGWTRLVGQRAFHGTRQTAPEAAAALAARRVSASQE